jgi:hypothetical protein
VANALPLWERPHVTARVRPFLLVFSGRFRGTRRLDILPLCARYNRLIREAGDAGRALKATGERWFGGHTVELCPLGVYSLARTPLAENRARCRSGRASAAHSGKRSWPRSMTSTHWEAVVCRVDRPDHPQHQSP